jgi:hypothetical protein
MKSQDVEIKIITQRIEEVSSCMNALDLLEGYFTAHPNHGTVEVRYSRNVQIGEEKRQTGELLEIMLSAYDPKNPSSEHNTFFHLDTHQREGKKQLEDYDISFNPESGQMELYDKSRFIKYRIGTKRPEKSK